MKKIILLITLMIILGINNCYSQLEPSQNLQVGIRAVEGKDYEDGIKYLTDYLESVPQSAEGRYNRAIAYYYLGDLGNALTDVTTAIGTTTSFSPALNLRGLIYIAKQMYDEALFDFNAAITANANFADAYMNRALVYKIKNEYPMAVADLNNAITINPTLMDAYYLRGELLVSMGNYNDAINDLTMYANNIANNAAVFAARGLAYFQLKKYTEAVEDLEKAIQLDPGFGKDYNTVLNNAKEKSGSK